MLASADATAAAAAAAVPAAVVVRNKSQKYYSLARSPLRLPGSADINLKRRGISLNKGCSFFQV